MLPLRADTAAAKILAAAFPAGSTPLHHASALARDLGVAELVVKNEAANPTGSLKDRAAALVTAAALAHQMPVVATASSGNAAASLAGAAAAVGLPCVVFLPETASAARQAQLLAYDARVLLVEGDYAAAVRLSIESCATWGWFCRTSAINPYTTQGKKTVALELLEQLGWSAPDAVVVPVGDGNILTGVHRGMRDALELGWIDRMPRLIGVQAAGAAAIYLAWSAGADRVAPAPAATVADGIRVAAPLDGLRAMEAVRSTGGVFTTVDEDAIEAAQLRLARSSGIVAEPASAAAAAALPALMADGVLGHSDRVALINTGRGADPGAQPARGPAPSAARVEPRWESVAAALPDLCVQGNPAAIPGLSVVSGT